MNPTEIADTLEEMATAPFDPSEFAYAFAAATGSPPATVSKLRSGTINKSKVPGAVLMNRKFYAIVTDPGGVDVGLAMIRSDKKTATHKPPILLATDGEDLSAENIATGERLHIKRAELHRHFGFFLPAAGMQRYKAADENPVDIKATGQLAKLYDTLLKDNPSWQTPERRHDLNLLMTRLVFCMFAEDVGIIDDNLFSRLIFTHAGDNGEEAQLCLTQAFAAMNRQKDARGELPDWTTELPYVNGGLFADTLEVPLFYRGAYRYLKDAAGLDWREINPDIFGSMIQSVADPEKRSELGMHYTSVPNILKVLGPLFLDDLDAQIEKAATRKTLQKVLDRIAGIRVFDPACGSGNFLVVAYRELRAREMAVLEKLAEVDGGQSGAMAIELPGGRSDKTPDCVANHVAHLLSDGAQITDRKTEQRRAAKPADIAVLCYTHEKCSAVAAAFDARGIPVRIRQPGWLTAPAMRAARAALAFIADPTDRLAALTWLTLGPPATPLRDALASAADGVLDTHTALSELRELSAVVDGTPVAQAVGTMLRATGLRDWAAGLAEPAQAVADLTRLEAEAQAFDTAEAGLRAAAGFHGCGLSVFLGWIVGQTDRGWDQHPDPDGWSGAGVAVVTWHAAKGLEWPITVVAGLDRKIASRPGKLIAEFEQFDDLSNVLAHAGVAWLPEFAAPESQELFAASWRAGDEEAASRALYVALTRARDRLVLALPPEQKNRQTTARMVDIFRDRAGLSLEGGAIRLGEQSFAAHVVPGDASCDDPVPPSATVLAGFGLPQDLPDLTRTPWRRSPSSLVGAAPDAATNLRSEAFGPAIDETKTLRATDRGSAWHRTLRTVLARPDLAPRLSASTGLSSAACAQIAAQAEALKMWLAARGFDKLHHEMPLQEVSPDGSETNAILDLLAEGPAGLLIVDHKSGPCPDPQTRFAAYRPQLTAYEDMVRAQWPGKHLQGVAINWMSEGVITLDITLQEQPA